MRRGGISYQPALDGLRAFAVSAVILYHLSYTWAAGGYLGVDAFFVLSGFLITTLLVSEHEGSGHVGLTAFWGRRARRLLPALFLLLTVVVLYGSATMTPLQLDELRGDALASLFYVANWHFIAAGQSYFDILSQPSPLQHLWSLAIEEQFYLLWPLVIVAVMGLARASRRVLVGLTVAGIVVSQLSMALLYDEGNPSRAYYGTEARAHTILVGCLLALLLTGRPEFGTRVRRVVTAAGAVAFGVCLVAWSQMEAGPRLFYGGDLAFALVAAVVILAAVQPAGFVRSFLGLGPFRYVGRISYGLYLWHWPVIVFMTAEDTGLSGQALNAFRLALTAAITVVSFHFLEQPILRGRLKPRLARIALPVSIVGVLVVILLGTATTPDPNFKPVARISHTPGGCGGATRAERDEARTKLDELGATADARSRGLRVLVIGDSIACSLLTGLEAEAALHGAEVENAAVIGCGVISGPVFTDFESHRQFSQRCPDLARERQERAIARAAPDVIVWWSEWETADLDVDGRRVDFWSPEAEAARDQRMEHTLQRLGRGGTPIVIVTAPPLIPSPNFAWAGEAWAGRHLHLNGTYFKFASRHRDDVAVVDLAKKICPRVPCRARVDGFKPRPFDGQHLSPAGAAWAAHWIWPQIVAAADR
jgi:peptidoglycan/LPS O-acetylase OafA/YrhL